MGVDFSGFTIYGAELDEDCWFVTEMDYGEDIDKPYTIKYEQDHYSGHSKMLVISNELVNKYNLDIIYDHYAGEWQILGINYLNEDPDQTIQNLTGIKEKWNNLLSELDLPIQKYQPYLMCDCYAW